MIFEIPNRNDALFSLYNLQNYKDFIMQKMHLFYFSEDSIKFILDKFKIKYKIFKCQRYDYNNHYNWIANNANKIPATDGIVNKVEFLSSKKRFLYLFKLLI